MQERQQKQVIQGGGERDKHGTYTIYCGGRNCQPQVFIFLKKVLKNLTHYVTIRIPHYLQFNTALFYYDLLHRYGQKLHLSLIGFVYLLTFVYFLFLPGRAMNCKWCGNLKDILHSRVCLFGDTLFFVVFICRAQPRGDRKSTRLNSSHMA